MAIGKLTGIRDRARKKSKKPKRFRKMVARWSFARISDALKHSLAQRGFSVKGKDARFIPIREYWTSITCHKCGHKGIRPKQSLFICHTCGYRSNADKNGAINIARRLITLIPSLRDEKGLGRWLFTCESDGSTLKVWRSSRSKRKSSRSQGHSDSKGESAVVRFVQSDLLSLGDGAGKSDEGPAVGNAAGTLSVTGCLDSPRTGASGVIRQQKEAASRKRGHAPMTAGKARATPNHLDGTEVSDDCHESGGTQELQVEMGFRSPSGNKEPAP